MCCVLSIIKSISQTRKFKQKVAKDLRTIDNVCFRGDEFTDNLQLSGKNIAET